jgi:hypothetical protein
MRLVNSLLGLLIVSATLWAGDPFVGRWDLNVDKSDFGNMSKAKSGSATYEADGLGYMFTTETVFGEGEVARLQTPVQFNGTAHEGHIDERMVTFLAKKFDEKSYEVVFSDRQTGKVVQRYRYTVIGNELTLNWYDDGDQRPKMMLVYDKQ